MAMGPGGHGGSALFASNVWTRRIEFDGQNNDGDAEAQPSTKLILEMTWKNKQHVGPGLRNLGNTCFMNAVLQSMTYIPCLAQYCLSNKYQQACSTQGFCAVSTFAAHVKACLSSRGNKPLAPRALAHKIKLIARHFQIGRQQDAHEYFIYLLDRMEQSIPKHLRKEHDIAAAVFAGKLQSCVTCMKCGHVSRTDQPFMDLCVELSGNTLEQCLALMVKEETLSGTNLYSCEKCKKKVKAKKGMKLRNLPLVCAIQLKRFDFTKLFGRKVNKMIEFPQHLDLRPYMHPEHAKHYPDTKYSLCSVVVHEGFTVDSGHYYAYVRAPNSAWYCMDDSQVQMTSLSRVLKQKAYMLFYTRTSQPSVNPDKKMPSSNIQSATTSQYQSQVASQDSAEVKIEVRDQLPTGVSPALVATSIWNVTYNFNGQTLHEGTQGENRAENDGWKVIMSQQDQDTPNKNLQISMNTTEDDDTSDEEWNADQQKEDEDDDTSDDDVIDELEFSEEEGTQQTVTEEQKHVPDVKATQAKATQAKTTQVKGWDGLKTSSSNQFSVKTLQQQSRFQVSTWSDSDDDDDESSTKTPSTSVTGVKSFELASAPKVQYDSDDDYNEEMDRGRVKKVRGPKTPTMDLSETITQVYKRKKEGKFHAPGSSQVKRRKKNNKGPKTRKFK